MRFAMAREPCSDNATPCIVNVAICRTLWPKILSEAYMIVSGITICAVCTIDMPTCWQA